MGGWGTLYLKTGAQVQLPRDACALSASSSNLTSFESDGKSLQLQRCVHGFPLIWVGQTLNYWETHCFSPWIIPIQRPAHFSSGGMGWMGCGWEAALCIGSTKTFHEVQVSTFLWTCTQKPFPSRDDLFFTVSVEMSNYTHYTDFSFAWFPKAWSTHLH